jgi:hypothetical protein
MEDMIYRQDAIDAIYEHEFSNWCDKDEVSTILFDLPSAEKTGKWIHAYDCDCFQCNQCGTPSIVAQPYCCICGAKMGVQDD